METNTGIYGAKVQSWQRANPRNTLKAVIDELPGASKEEIFEAWKDRISGEERDVTLEYWFANNYNSIAEPAPMSRAGRAAIAAEAEKEASDIRAAADRAINERAKIILLDMAMPNGKALRDCTGKDCAKFGGWFAGLAAKVKPSERIGDVLSEKQVRGLYGK